MIASKVHVHQAEVLSVRQHAALCDQHPQQEYSTSKVLIKWYAKMRSHAWGMLSRYMIVRRMAKCDDKLRAPMDKLSAPVGNSIYVVLQVMLQQ